MRLTITPRLWDAKSKAEVIGGFTANRDFTVDTIMSPHCGRAVSQQDLIATGEKGSITLRYSRQTKLVIVDIETGEEVK